MRKLRSERAWPSPHPVSEAAFHLICAEHKIVDATHKREFRIFLDELVKFASEMLERVRRTKSPSSYHRELTQLSAAIERIASRLSHLTSAGRHPGSWLVVPKELNAIARVAATGLSAFLNNHYLAEVIPGITVPHNMEPDQLLGRKPQREWAHDVIEHNAAVVLVEVFRSLHETLAHASATVKANTPRGGPRRYVVGPFIIMNLAGAYERVGRSPAYNIHGPFGRFMEDVVCAIGLPTDWIESHLGNGVKMWKERKDRKDRENPSSKNSS